MKNNVNIARFSSISHFTKQNFKARKKYLFSTRSDLFKSAKKVPCLRFRNVPIEKAKRHLFNRKRYLFAVTSNIIKSVRKVPLKINEASIKILLIDRCQPLAPPTNDTQTFLGDSRSRFYNCEFRSPESN